MNLPVGMPGAKPPAVGRRSGKIAKALRTGREYAGKAAGFVAKHKVPFGVGAGIGAAGAGYAAYRALKKRKRKKSRR